MIITSKCRTRIPRVSLTQLARRKRRRKKKIKRCRNCGIDASNGYRNSRLDSMP